MTVRSSGSSRLSRLAMCLGAALQLAPGAAVASVGLGVSLPALTPPFSNAVTLGQASSLTFTVTNTGDQAAHRVDFQLPTSSYTTPSGVAPDASWSVTTFTTGGVWVVRFYTACNSAGLAPGATATFVVGMQVPVVAIAADSVTSAIQINASTRTNASRCGAPAAGSASIVAPVKALQVLSGVPAPAQGLGAPMTGVVTWMVANRSSAAQAGVTMVPVVSPAAGASGSCTTLASLASGANGTVTCTYALSSPATTFTFAANARDATGNATAVGAAASGAIAVGASSVAWSKAVMAYGRAATYTLGFRVQNISGTTVSRVDLTNPSPSGFTVSAASATSGLAYAPGSSTTADLVFTGSLAAGATSNISVTFSAVPTVASTTSYTFGVRLSPAAGTAYAMTTSQQVVLVVPISDVAGLTIQANSAGQTLAWTNTSAHGSTHDGVVVFRAAAGSVPAVPVDFTVYAAGSGGVVFADGAGSTASTFLDTPPGSFNYRVCNRDAYHVYSGCSTGFWNGAGWLDSEAFPTGGWVHAVAGSALVRPSFLTGGRFAIGTNAPNISAVDLATGARAFAPVTLSSLPSGYTPVGLLSNGRKVVFAADQSGGVTAVDLDSGAVYWQVSKANQNFTAGVSGIVRWSAAPEFATAYPMDILLLGSTTGTVFAIDATTGATLWTISAGAPVYAMVNYDPATNIFYVATAGAGVKAYTLTGSSPTVAPTSVSTWSPPDPSGTYRHFCILTAGGAGVACLNTSGVLWVMDKRTGSLQAPAYASAITTPTGLARISGGSAVPGLVISSASSIEILSATGTPYTLRSIGTWSPGLTLSNPVVYAGSGSLVVGGSDRRLHRVSLSTAVEASQSIQVGTQSAGVRLGQPIFDTVSGLYVFGTSDGHIWALPSF